nr:unnamed protein product [Callosobruchus analis]
MSETLQLKGTLLGHNGWVTQIATNPKYPDMIYRLLGTRPSLYGSLHAKKHSMVCHRRDYMAIPISSLMWCFPVMVIMPFLVHGTRLSDYGT